MSGKNWQQWRRWKATRMSLTHLLLSHWHKYCTKWIHSPGDWTTAIFNILARKASTLDQLHHIPAAEPATASEFCQRYRCNRFCELTRPLQLEWQVFMHKLRNRPYTTPRRNWQLQLTVSSSLMRRVVTRCRDLTVTWRCPAILNEFHFGTQSTTCLLEPV